MVDSGSSGFTIRNSWFAYNGYDVGTCSDSSHCVSDGLTVIECPAGGSIHDNTFWDNTDVDLIVGGGNCTIQNNTIQHFSTYGYAGLMVEHFPNGGSSGNHTGAIYSGNRISSPPDQLAFGIMVGHHPWDSLFDLGNAGSVTGNAASGSVINLAVEGISGGGNVTGNSASGAQGQRAYGSCRPPKVPRDYTVYHPHAGSAVLQSGSFELQFDGGACTPRQYP